MEAIWNYVKIQDDIAALRKQYGGFHDACIKELHYSSGVTVDTQRTMHFQGPEDAVLTVVFQRQWEPISIELKFIGLRRMNLIGYQDNYFGNMMDCYLAFYQNHIVWADESGFSIDEPEVGCLLEEPMITFVVADQLAWRIIDG